MTARAHLLPLPVAGAGIRESEALPVACPDSELRLGFGWAGRGTRAVTVEARRLRLTRMASYDSDMIAGPVLSGPAPLTRQARWRRWRPPGRPGPAASAAQSP